MDNMDDNIKFYYEVIEYTFGKQLAEKWLENIKGEIECH